MAFCQKCGNKLEDGAKFCASCGTPVGDTGAESVRKQTFVGDIKKCPSCGAEIPSMTAICPECGHEISNSKVSEVLKEFQAGLVKYEGEEERDFVASFPIPNTKEDLGNFLSMVASILLTDLQNGSDTERVTSFISKFQEIKNKMEIILTPTDPLQEQAKKWEDKIVTAKANYDAQKKSDKRKRGIVSALKSFATGFAKHPIRNSIIAFYAISFILLGIFEGFQAIYKKSIKANKIEIQKESVVLQPNISNYIDITSPVVISTTKGLTSCSVSFDIVCKKSLKDDLDAKLSSVLKAKKIARSDVNVEFYNSFHFLGSRTLGKQFLEAVLNIQKNETINVKLIDSKIDSYKKEDVIENLKSVKETETVAFDNISIGYEVYSLSGNKKLFSVEFDK